MRTCFPTEKDLDGFNEFVPSDHIPVAGLPDAVRDQKSAWLNTVSVRAVFSSEVEDGDLVVPITREGSNNWHDPNTVWIPALSLSANQQAVAPSTPSDFSAPKFYGVAYKAVNRVMVGPVVYHPSFSFPVGAAVYAVADGKMSAEPSSTRVGTCLAPGCIRLFGASQDIGVITSAVADLRDASLEAIREEGAEQLERVQRLADTVLLAGISHGAEATLTISGTIQSGTVLLLPEEVTYIVGYSMLRLSRNGDLLYLGEHFEEMGEIGTASNQIRVLIDLAAGDKLNAFVISQNVTVTVDESSGLTIDDDRRLSAAPIKAQADQALSTASGAVDAAEDARTVADAAQATAVAAQATANTAQAAAEAAQAAANAAQESADAAVKTINGESPDDDGNLVVSGISVGDVILCATNKVSAGFLLCNGAAISRKTYAKLFAAIGTIYGSGDGSTTFNLPNLIDRFIQGSATAGTVKEAGLPNITGGFQTSSKATSSPWLRMSGWDAFAGETRGTTSIATVDVLESVNNTGLYNSVNFDASRSSSVYGSSTTVQPPAVTMLPCIKY